VAHDRVNKFISARPQAAPEARPSPGGSPPRPRHHLARAVLQQVYFADRSCAEAAAVLGIPVGTVKSRLYHALRHLREAIQAGPAS